MNDEKQNTLKNYWINNFCLYLHHQTVLIFILHVNFFGLKYNIFGQFRGSYQLSPDLMKMYNQYGFVFNLNLHCWQVFDKIDSSEYVIIFTTPGSFSDEKYDVEKKNTSDVKNRKYCSIFFPLNITQQNIVPVKTCILHRTF